MKAIKVNAKLHANIQSYTPTMSGYRSILPVYTAVRSIYGIYINAVVLHIST
jgi:hypothetical protein